MAKIKLSNTTDEDKAREGSIPREAVRRVEVEALVDTGATMLVIPEAWSRGSGFASTTGGR